MKYLAKNEKRKDCRKIIFNKCKSRKQASRPLSIAHTFMRRLRVPGTVRPAFRIP
jgi:hypothetical protein